MRASGNMPHILVLTAALIMLTAPGCDRYARYRVLTFFFTGVPPLEQDARPGEKDREEAKKRGEDRKKKRPSVIVKATRFSHGPYASGECYQCHETSASGGMRGLGKKDEAAGSLAKAGVIPGKLVAPLNELCGSCHDGKSNEKAYQEGLWVHGPVSSGYCTLCHGPHAGPNLYLLIKKADELCLECHTEGYLGETEAHRQRQGCVSCHNAHVGKDRMLLSHDYAEPFQLSGER